jgi:alpha-galactosidase
MMYKIVLFLAIHLIPLFSVVNAQKTPGGNPKKLTPVMGWASWNNYRININENLVRRQADAMVSSGMKKAGYSFVNIDDGYFGGRDENGNIIPHPSRFPNGMKRLAEYIHSKGLKAGIYSDAGINTCASMWDKDTIGSGMGLYGHEVQDIKQLLQNWNYDFLKVDWCGAEALGLDEEMRYTQIGKLVYQVRPDAVYNVCRWKFPGKWVTGVADSWRISGDIDNHFESILKIIDLNAELWKYAGPGHVNDMDMLQVGRGMSLEEDKTHFSMWCMMASPLLAGNDLTKMTQETIAVLTNPEMISIDQDPLVYQARRLFDYGETEIWARPLGATMSGKVAVALLNRSNTTQTITFKPADMGINSSKGYYVRNIWMNTSSQKQVLTEQSFEVAPHGAVVLKISGSAIPFNVFQKQ